MLLFSFFFGGLTSRNTTKGIPLKMHILEFSNLACQALWQSFSVKLKMNAILITVMLTDIERNFITYTEAVKLLIQRRGSKQSNSTASVECYNAQVEWLRWLLKIHLREMSFVPFRWRSGKDVMAFIPLQTPAILVPIASCRRIKFRGKENSVNWNRKKMNQVS